MKHFAAILTALFLFCNFQYTHAQLLSESFDGGTFPPAGWTNVQISGFANPGTWQRLTSGTNPSASPHSGAGMAYYNGYSWSSGNAGELATPALNFSSGNFAVSFWMYRDSGQADKYDSVSIYVNVNASSVGGTRLGVINRSRAYSPAASADGWYQYTFNIPGNYNTGTNHIIFKGTSGFGNRMYIDDISVYSLTPPSDPTGVSAADTSICPGQQLKLYASGIDGTVYWYTGSCGGTLVGTGDSIFLVPTQSDTYYARNYNNSLFSVQCASLQVSINQVYNTSSSATICASETYQLANGIIADSTGTYVVTVPSSNGCDSTITLALTVLAPVSTNVSVSTCAGYPYIFNAQQLTQAGTYFDTLNAVSGCDSIIVLQLSILNTASNTIAETICAGTSFNFNGQLLTTAGTYYDTLTAANTCDSIVTLQLSVTNPSQTSISEHVCYGNTYDFNGTILSQSGTYLDTLTSSAGCDSIITLALVIAPQITYTYTHSLCSGDSLLFNGNYYLQSGTYSDTLISGNGCDSIVSVALNILPAIENTITQSICSGDSVSFNGIYYSQAGTYPDTLTALAGCDSIVILQLIINTIDTPVITQNGLVLTTQTYSSYQWLLNGTPISDVAALLQTYTASGNGAYSVQVVDSNGCSAESAGVTVTGVGIREATNNDWVIYPNPANNILVFRNLLLTGQPEAEVYSTTGQLMMKANLTDNRLNIETLSAGVYNLTIRTEHDFTRRIFVKE